MKRQRKFTKVLKGNNIGRTSLSPAPMWGKAACHTRGLAETHTSATFTERRLGARGAATPAICTGNMPLQTGTRLQLSLECTSHFSKAGEVKGSRAEDHDGGPFVKWQISGKSTGRDRAPQPPTQSREEGAPDQRQLRLSVAGDKSDSGQTPSFTRAAPREQEQPGCRAAVGVGRVQPPSWL